MKKAYSAPSLFAEDFSMYPIIAADCENAVYLSKSGGYIPDIAAGAKDVQLYFANSHDCVGWATQMSIETGMWDTYGWGFNTVSDAPWASVCNQQNIDAAIIAVGGDPAQSWYNLGLYPYECYNTPAFVIVNFASL